MTHPATAYKVLTAEQMAALEQEGVFTGAPVDIADGYIHLSTAAQLTETVDKHFANQTDLHIAAVDLEAMGEAVKWEESRGGQLFPHLYQRRDDCCGNSSMPASRSTVRTRSSTPPRPASISNWRKGWG